MKELKNIEEQFKQELLGMDIPPTRSSDELWGGISAQLDVPTKKRRGLIWTAGFLALLGIAFFAGYTAANRSVRANKTNVLTTDIPNWKYQNTQQSGNNVTEKQNLIHPLDDVPLPTSSSFLPNITKNEPAKREEKRKIKQPSFFGKKDEITRFQPTEKQLELNNRPSIVNPLLPNYAAVNTSGSATTTPASTRQKDFETPQFFRLAALDAKALGVFLRTPKIPGGEKKQLPSLSSFLVGLSYTPAMLFYPEQEGLKTKAQVGHGIQLFAEKTIKRLHFGCGLQWQQMGYHFLYKNRKEGTFTYTNTLLEVIRDENLNIVEEIYGDTTVRSIETIEVSHNNRYTLLGINVYARYAPFKNTPRTTFGAGFTGYRVMAQNGRYLDDRNDFTPAITTASSGLRSWGLMPYATFDHSIPLSRQWSVTSSLRVHYLPQQLWSTAQPASSFLPSLNIGIRRTFIRS
jgi:hypothetical protein